MEQSLRNKNIKYINKVDKLDSLLAKNSFWGIFIELLIADSLSKEKCKVTLLGNANHRHHDLNVNYKRIRIKIEVSSRAYKVNKNNSKRIIRQKLKNKAYQLPRNGINIIILLLEDSLGMPSKIDIQNSLTCFNVFDAMYDDNQYEAKVKRSKTSIIKKRKSILDTYQSLKHISAVGFWFNNQYALSSLGKRTGMFLFEVKQSAPKELRNLLCKLNQNVGSLS